jgi:hypothetical protein
MPHLRERAIASEALVTLFYEIAKSDPVGMDFFAENDGTMYLYQEDERTAEYYTNNGKLAWVEKQTFYEEFLLDRFGVSVLQDPKVDAAPWPKYCKMLIIHECHLELVWKKPKSGSGKMNKRFHYYGSEKYALDPDMGSEMEPVKGWPDPYVDGGRRGYDVVPLRVYGSYDVIFEVDHCRIIPTHGRIPVSTPGDEVVATPPETGGGTPTPPSNGGPSLPPAGLSQPESATGLDAFASKDNIEVRGSQGRD